MEVEFEEKTLEVATFEEIARRRRSVYFFTAEEVPRDLINRALGIAVLAPNHHHTRPWRFAVFSGKARARLADAYSTAADRIGWAPSRARHRAYDAPVMIVIGCIPTAFQPRVRPLEEEFSTAAATQNLMLALTAMGLGSALNTSPVHCSDEVSKLAGMEDGRVVAVLQVGYRDHERGLVKRPEPVTAGVVTWHA